MPQTPNPYPRLNDRALGWLRHLHRKATTPDDWSEDGEPHPWWDRFSTEPTLSFARFDLSESSYALGLMADETPAWREVYEEILRGLVERHLTYWAAIDWLTQFGADPRRQSYPQAWIDAFIPEHLVGKYDSPGWVANGIAPWGLQPDPIGATGNLFFRGFLNLIQSLHAYVSGEDLWGSPFEVAGVERARFSWTQHRIVEHLTEKWKANPLGSHCENTKIWPYCLTAAGLGLQLYDAVFQKNAHAVYHEWLAHTKDAYYGISKEGALEWTSFYYDPIRDHLQRTGAPFGLVLSFYTAPQDPVFAEFLYRAAIRALGWDNPAAPISPMADPRIPALGMAAAKEFGDSATEARLRAFGEEHFEPRHFGRGESEFGFWFHLGEEWPRGQLSALAMVAEVGSAGAWQRLFRAPNLAKFDEPTLEGVDYPALGISQAYYDKDAAMLLLATFRGGAKEGATVFRVSRLSSPDSVRVIRDGADYPRWRVLDAETIEISTTLDAHFFQILTDYDGERRGEKKALLAPPLERRGAKKLGAKRGGGQTARAAPPALISPPSSCGVCACGGAPARLHG